ncbi:hypothetical protein AB0N05_05620 [Nocardia sp. NPDC051030]|uniref:hypothetical protein n=1 Tax=Nocardia sp. NPDC051030 TaxID=3155162 RepID=UPI0034211450
MIVRFFRSKGRAAVVLAVLVAVIGFAMAGNSSADVLSHTPLVFAQGTNTATVHDTVVKGSSTTYVVEVAGNQKMTVETSGPVSFAVFDPSGAKSAANVSSPYTADVTAGTWQIIIGSTQGGEFDLTVTVV